MVKDKEYETELDKAREEYEDLMERGKEALGDEDEYDELEREFFTEEEIKESELKAALMETLLKIGKDKGISQKRLVELGLELFEDYLEENKSYESQREIEIATA